jgi:hypothetical protein
MRMNRTHTTGLVVFAVIVFLVGMISTGGNLLGNTVATATLPTGQVEVGEAEVVESAVLDQAVIQDIIDNPQRVTPLPVEKIDTETLWLARVIYSETKRPEEQELVAWAVRNRVETNFRGNESYRAAVLDPFQFSAFNMGDRKRDHYSRLTAKSNAPGFDRALTIAYAVKHADASKRPFGQTVRHFYSERSMVGQRHPNWARDGVKVDPKRSFTLDERRFRFFADVR